MMKKLLFVFIALTLSNFARAADKCDAEVLKIAQMNIDYVAKSIGWENAAAVYNPTKVSSEKVEIIPGLFETDTTFDVGGEIYKGQYDIQVTVDESCVLVAVKIRAIAN